MAWVDVLVRRIRGHVYTHAYTHAYTNACTHVYTHARRHVFTQVDALLRQCDTDDNGKV